MGLLPGRLFDYGEKDPFLLGQPFFDPATIVINDLEHPFYMFRITDKSYSVAGSDYPQT